MLADFASRVLRRAYRHRLDGFLSQFLRDRGELLQGGLKVVGDLLGQNVGGGQVVGVLETLVP